MLHLVYDFPKKTIITLVLEWMNHLSLNGSNWRKTSSNKHWYNKKHLIKTMFYLNYYYFFLG